MLMIAQSPNVIVLPLLVISEFAAVWRTNRVVESVGEVPLKVEQEPHLHICWGIRPSSSEIQITLMLYVY